jgi:ADP-heptose:LPS heptosyltransferase
MGVDDPNFERNLIFTVNCSHPADITMIPMSGDSASSQHISSRYIAGFAARTGQQPDDFTFDRDCTLITPHKADLIQGREILTGYDIDSQKHLVMIHPGSGGIHKSWNLRNFLDLADALTTAAAADIEVAFLLGPAELERLSADQIARIQSTCRCITERDLKDVVQMLACSDCFVGNDSGLTHIAGAMGLPTIAVFGPTDPSLYGPLGPQVHIHRIDPDRFSQPSPSSVRAVSEAVLHYLSH